MEAKVCNKCKESRRIEDFNLLPSGNRFAQCKFCLSSYLKEYHKKWARENKDKLKKYKKKYSSKPGIKEKLSASRQAWRVENIERDRKNQREWERKNLERKRLLRKKSREKPENKASAIARNAKRKATQLWATPKWANFSAIRNIYLESRKQQMHVDHIVPLRSRLVCGLHVEHNLRLLDAKENLKKNNLVWPDMP